MPVFQAALVTAQLLVDLLSSSIQGLMRVRRISMRLQDKALHDVGNNVACKHACRSFPECHMRGNRAIKVFVYNPAEPVSHMLLQRCPGFDLMA